MWKRLEGIFFQTNCFHGNNFLENYIKTFPRILDFAKNIFLLYILEFGELCNSLFADINEHLNESP